MMLTIYGLPPYMKYFDIKKIIREECNIFEFLLSNLVYDADGTKQVQICFVDEDEGNLAIRYLEGYRLAGYVLRIVPFEKANHENGQEDNDNGYNQNNNQPESDYGNSFTEPVRNNQIPWSVNYDNPEPHNKNLRSDLSCVPSAHNLPQPQTEDGDTALVLSDAEVNQNTIGPPAQVHRYSHMPYSKQVTIVNETTQYTGHLSNEHQELYQSYDYHTSPKPCSSKSQPALTQNDRHSYKAASHRNNDSYKNSTPQLNTYNNTAPVSPMTKPPLFTKPVKRSLIEKALHNKPPMKIAKMTSGPNSVPNNNVCKAKGQPMVKTKGIGHKPSTQPSKSTVGTGTDSLVSALIQPTRNANAVGVGAWEVESFNGKGKKSKKSVLIATRPIEKPLAAVNKKKAKKKNRKQHIKARLQAEMAASVLQEKSPGEVPLLARSSCVDSGGLPKTSGAKQPSVEGSCSSIGTKGLTKKLKTVKRLGKKERAAMKQYWNSTVTSNEIHNLSSSPDDSQNGGRTIDLEKMKSFSTQKDDPTSVAEPGLPTVIEPVIELENTQSCSTLSVSECRPLPIKDPKVTVSNNPNHHRTTSTAGSMPSTVIEPVEIASENIPDRGNLVDVHVGDDATVISKKANILTIVKSEEDQSCAATCATGYHPAVVIELDKVKPENTQDDDSNSVANSSVIEPEITPDNIQNRCFTSVAESPPAVRSTFEDDQNHGTSPDVEFVKNNVDGNISSNPGQPTSIPVKESEVLVKLDGGVHQTIGLRTEHKSSNLREIEL
ncbi:unnamed protein product [Parnassius apollo]|uniref:(apollo) hypothetical protein n=1 Tax=Parnassius apollo TaxID=110799 RepID=A0A8S3YH47_PARAO|nr:unnamed protein product [Parnassius apollo]